MPKLNDIPVCPDPPAVRLSTGVTKEYQISLVTPLFGGGVEAGMPDESLPIRGTSIRGQLQFWWRATRGAGLVGYKKLFDSHTEIWGTTDKASLVRIEVCDLKPNPMQFDACARYEWNGQARQGRGRWDLVWQGPFSRPKDHHLTNPLPYALFPFQGKEPRSREGTPEKAPAQYVPSGSFMLRLHFPEALQEDIETTVWAWVNFGGLGARTRRGCGVLLCKEFAPKDIGSLDRWFKSAPFNSVSNSVSDVRAWPTMSRNALVGNQAEAPIDAWKKAIGLLQAFRQGERVGRNPGQQHNRPGRSRWPEPETIRRVTGRRSSQHTRLSHVPDDAFPRAEFGLPIVFHFQGNEVPDTVLYPLSAPDGEERERMASPLIIKPLALADGKAVPLIMRLVTPPLTGVDLRQGSSSHKLPASTVTRASTLATYRDSPLASSSAGSAVEAFLQHARNNGFHEITR